MAEQEEKFVALESLFASTAGVTFNEALNKALNSGQSVLQSDQGFIYEVFPDGTRKRVKAVAPPTPVEPGKKITIR
jgi:hypothetical protein